MHTTPMKQQRTGQIKQIWFNLIWTRAESSSTDKTGVFFGGFCLFFATSFAGRNAHRKDIPKKQTNPVCFVLRQESPIQRSATPAWQVGDNFCDHPLFRDRPNLIIQKSEKVSGLLSPAKNSNENQAMRDSREKSSLPHPSSTAFLWMRIGTAVFCLFEFVFMYLYLYCKHAMNVMYCNLYKIQDTVQLSTLQFSPKNL